LGINNEKDCIMSTDPKDPMLAKLEEAIFRYGNEGLNAGITDDEKLFQYVVDKLTADGLGPDNGDVGRAVVMHIIREVGEHLEHLDRDYPVVLTDRTLRNLLDGIEPA
jgi:hypothetical protein